MACSGVRGWLDSGCLDTAPHHSSLIRGGGLKLFLLPNLMRGLAASLSSGTGGLSCMGRSVTSLWERGGG